MLHVLSPAHDHFHDLAIPGSYEWSYYDGLSEDGEWGFVAIWFRGCPMSPWYTAAIDRSARNPHREHPDPIDHVAVNFALYHRERRIFHLLRASRGSDWRAIGPDVRLGRNGLHTMGLPDGRRRTSMTLDLHRLGSRLVGEIDLVAPIVGATEGSGDVGETSRGHFWVPIEPGGDVAARLELRISGMRTRPIRFSGRSYHDRNVGTDPLHHLQADWFWGRLHAGGRTFIYYAVLPDDLSLPSFKRVMLFEEGTPVQEVADFDFVEGARRRHWSTLSCADELRGRRADGASVFTARRRAFLDSGPFYHRMLSDIIVQEENGRELRGIGMCEYLRPDRLGIAAFRPFVKMRVSRRAERLRPRP